MAQKLHEFRQRSTSQLSRAKAVKVDHRYQADSRSRKWLVAYAAAPLAWACMALLAAVCAVVAWPDPVPDPHFIMQSALDYVDEEHATGLGHEKSDAMFDWYEQSATFEKKCSIVTISAQVFGFSMGHLLCCLVGWSGLKRRYLVGFLCAASFGLASVVMLPEGPPDPVWGHAFDRIIAISVSVAMIVIAAILEVLLLAASLAQRHRLYRSRKAWLALGSVTLIIGSFLTGRFFLRSDWDLARSGAGNQQMVLVRWMPNLEWLSVSNTDVGDDGLRHLKGKRIRHLDLSRTQVTDAGLAHLKELDDLKSLDLTRTQITDAGVEHLKHVKGLQSLDLTSTKVTDAGLSHLREIPLQWLFLTNTQVSDDGLDQITQLHYLQCLGLSNTSISDAGVTELSKFTQIDTMFLDNTDISVDGLRELHARLPDSFVWPTVDDDDGIVQE